MIDAPLNLATAKEMGAFYTNPAIADFLVQWAVRKPNDLVIDPSFGGGVFLRAAAKQVASLGGDPIVNVFGVELDALMYEKTTSAAVQEGLNRQNLRRDDFFAAANELSSSYDAAVGNPPFIRYQQFGGSSRERANAIARAQGVEISELASSWAPFLVATVGVLREGGRLAMVVPMELCHASYGRTVLDFLTRSFSTIQLLSFETRLFPELSQDTMLLLAEDRRDSLGEVRWRHLKNVESLSKLNGNAAGRIPRARKLDASALASGQKRLIEEFLPSRARDLYQELRQHPSVHRLGSVADVGIGYVTGANDFFHLSEEAVCLWGIPRAFLRRAVCRGRAFAGLKFTKEDWQQAYQRGDAAQLLMVGRNERLGDLKKYIQHGESRGVHQGYKCRMRDPWYHVPHVYAADGFLTYMSGISPQLVMNVAEVVAPNTLHIVRMHPIGARTIEQLCLSWQSSLAQLSSEIEGHAMGGGMLKLEPTEAERVLVPIRSGLICRDALATLDALMRHGRPGAAQKTIDRMVLREELGLTVNDCKILSEAIEVMRSRRLRGGSK